MRSEHRQTVAGNVRAEMARAGKRQSDVAAALGISQQATSRRITGEIALDVDELHAIARFLSVPVSALLAGTDEAVSA